MNRSYLCVQRFFVILTGIVALALALFVQGAAASESSIVGVSVPAGTIGPGEAFTVEIYCDPGEPVRAFEANFQFDPTLFEINTVVQGTLFTGYPSFFSEGVIDNTEGTVSNILGVILGSGNVTTNGTLLTVPCTAKETLGSSTIDLYNVGLTDETQYVSLVINDGLVTVASQTGDPLITSPDPANGSTTVPLSRSSLSVSIESPDGDTFNHSIWTSPNIGSDSGAAETNGTKTCSINGLSYETTYHWYVCCRDSSSGNWTNRTFIFSTEEDPGSDDDTNNGGGAPPGGGGGFSFPDLETEDEEEPIQNRPPSQPLKPSGPLFIELGVDYEFTSSSFDPDEGRLRYRFDWGDGHISSWSDFHSSNASVTMTHRWEEPSTFSLRLIAQDEQGVNSSWSEPLSVTVSQEVEGAPPLPDIQSPTEISVNQTMEFNASGSIDLDGEITSYFWDFGDGTTSIEIHPLHKYRQPGTYEVTLTVTDDQGNTYSKTITVTVNPEGSFNDNEQIAEGVSSLSLLHLMIIILGIFGGAMYYFRDRFHLWKW